MTTEQPSLLRRIKAGLDWPSWQRWPDHVAVDARPAPRHSSAPGATTSGRGRAMTTADGGPWLDVFEPRSGVGGHADPAGPLAGTGFAIKALMAIEGHVTTAASPVRADAAVERATAPFITMLANAGAEPLGTVTMHEFAFGVTGVNDYAGTAPNPAAPDRVPGGSSAGSASAVADGSADFAIGTDTGGSVRIPSAFCGIAGFKPAHGTYPAAGAFPVSATLDHVGLHARTLEQIVTVHRALGYPVAPPHLPRRVGVALGDLEAADTEVATVIEAALGELAAAGVELVDIEVPDPEASFVASTGIMFSEAAAIHAEGVAAHRDRYGADIAARLDIGAALSGPHVAAAHRLRGELIGRVSATLAAVDLIATATVPIVAPRLADAADPSLAPRIVANTRLANLVGLPAVSLPAPTDGLPVGLHLMGIDNAATLAAAGAVEALLAG